MALQLLMMRGLPGSGKSTWSTQLLHDAPGKYKRVNRDSLRAMIDGGLYGSHREKIIRKIELMVAEQILSEGYSVIVDDCNLSSYAVEMWTAFAKEHKLSVIWKDFTDVPLEECIARDLKRPNSVGEQVIRTMYTSWLQPAVVPVTYNPLLPDAYIFDLDGTLAQFTHRGPYETEKCAADVPNRQLVELARYYASKGNTIIITSGRKEAFRALTEAWIQEHAIPCHLLFMRPDEDTRRDFQVKQDMYDTLIKAYYNVLAVYDDRAQVVAMWRANGLFVLQVAEGNY